MPVDATLMVLGDGVHDRLAAAVPTAGIVAVFLGSQTLLPLVIPLSSTAFSSCSGARDIKCGALCLLAAHLSVANLLSASIKFPIGADIILSLERGDGYFRN